MKEFDIYDAYYVMSAIAFGSLVLNLVLAIKLTLLKQKLFRAKREC